MEFPFDINHVLPYEVTIFNGDYRVLNQGHSIRVQYGLKNIDVYLTFAFSSASEKLTAIIDAIGEASYKVKAIIRRNHFRVGLGTGIIWCSDNSTEISYFRTSVVSDQEIVG